LAIVQLVLDKAEAYKWVKYIYIDDPISSVDEHNAIVVANHLVQLFRDTPNQLKTVISTHHVLFFNVLSNEIKNLLSTRDFPQYCLSRSRKSVDYLLFLHGFHYLKDEGVMAIILPHGVLFRGGAEERIRTKLLTDGHSYC
jgi:N-6 DNA Methylase